MIKKIGSRIVITGILTLTISSLVTMIISTNIILTTVCFILYFALNTCLFLGLDILIEHWSENSNQGSIRGIYLTIMSLGFMTGPFIGGYILDRLGYASLYGFAIILIIPIIFIVLLRIPNIAQAHASKSNIIGLAKKFLNRPDLGAVFLVNFTLQFFYAWMVIYGPIYLHEHAHIAWDTLGIMFTIMLSAFVVFQYATGVLADRYHIEKYLMAVGLGIMGLATIFFAQAPELTLVTITIILFTTRVGASIVEVMTESYFFKRVNHQDMGSIGFFRNTYPFAYILAPLIASLVLNYTSLGTLFTILGIICILAIGIVTNIKRKPL
jgi:MFS family permease